MLTTNYHTKGYVNDIAIITNNNQQTALFDMSTNQIVGNFDEFFCFQICYNRLIFQYKLNRVRVFDTKTKEMLFEDAEILVPTKVFKTPDNMYHCLNYSEAFDKLDHSVFRTMTKVSENLYFVESTHGFGYYDLELGYQTRPNEEEKVLKKRFS